MRAYKVLELIIWLVFYTGCGQPTATSEFAVVNGATVTSPDQAPGTYQLIMFYGGQPIQNSTAVAVGSSTSHTTFITAGHSVDPNSALGPIGSQGLRYDPRQVHFEVRDYQNQLVSQFPFGGDTRMIFDNGAYSTDRTQAITHDIAAMVVPSSGVNLTQGQVSLGQNISGSLTAVGNGWSDYTPPAGQSNGAGQLRYGSVVDYEKVGNASIFFDGPISPNTPTSSRNAGIGPGDSGGSLLNSDGQIVGILQGSAANVTYEAVKEHGLDAVGKSPGMGMMHAMTFEQNRNFFDTVSMYGNVSGHQVYYDPQSLGKIEQSQFTQYAQQYGDVWRDNVITKDSGTNIFSGYENDLQYRPVANQTNTWQVYQGDTALNYYAQQSTQGSWVYATEPTFATPTTSWDQQSGN